MVTRTATALLLGAVLLSPGLAAGQEAHSLEQIVVEMAKTPADHAALAAHYRAQAEEARADMRRHESMGRAYMRGSKQRTGASSHCKRLAERYGAMAGEYDELAKLHEEEASKAR